MDSFFERDQASDEPPTLAKILGMSSLQSQQAETAGSALHTLKTGVSSDKFETQNETQNTPKQLTAPGTFRKRPLVSRSNSKLRQPFKSPLQSRQQSTMVKDKSSLLEEIESLKAKLEILNKDNAELNKEYNEEELQLHIQKLHEYNEIKDVGQLLIGKLAEIDGTTTRAMYQEFGLDLDD